MNEEFKERFWNEPSPWEGMPSHLVHANIWTNYATALKNAAKSPRLSEFLITELPDAKLDGKPEFYHEQEEHFTLNLPKTDHEKLLTTIAKYYNQQWLQTSDQADILIVMLNDMIFCLVAIAFTPFGAEVSVS